MNFVVAWLAEASECECDNLYQARMGIWQLNGGVGLIAQHPECLPYWKHQWFRGDIDWDLEEHSSDCQRRCIYGTSITALSCLDI